MSYTLLLGLLANIKVYFCHKGDLLIDTSVEFIQWLLGVNITFTLSVQVDENFYF